MKEKTPKENQESTNQEILDKNPMTKEEIKQRLSVRAFEYMMFLDDED